MGNTTDTDSTHFHGEEQPVSCRVALSFSIGSGGSELFIELTEAEEPNDLSITFLHREIKDMGFDGYDVDTSKLETVLEKAQSLQYGSYPVGSKQIAIDISLDYDIETRQLSATLSKGGTITDWSHSSVQELIAEKGFDDVEIQQKTLVDLLSCIKNHSYTTILLGKKPEYTDISFRFEQESNTLFAILTPSEKKQTLTPPSLQEKIKEEGYGDYYFEPNAVNGIFKSIKKNERGEFKIATRKNAVLEVEFDKEIMHAYATLHPPYGGRLLDQELLEIELKNAEVDLRACDQNVLKKMMADQEADKLLFATGKEPVDGKDAEFKALVEETVTKVPEKSKSGKIDTKEVLDFTIVDPGTQLMERIPVVEGINGYNVKGQAIPAVEGVDIPFNEELPGAQIDDSNPNILIATAKGHPVILKDGVKVDKTLAVNNVALSTGHITFDGSLLVRGEVMPGMKINVTGDIIVEGVVTNAILRAKNNITVKCGVIGADPEDKEHPEYTCILKAGGDITAQYINQTNIHAGHDVIVKEYISHCHTEVRHKVLAGMSGGKGKIFGGDVYAQAGVAAKTIGADGISTMVTVGSALKQQKQYEELLKNQERRHQQLAKLELIFKKQLTDVKAHPNDLSKLDKAKTIKKVVEDLKAEIKKIDYTIDQIELYFKKSRQADITVMQTTFPNVQLHINGATFNIRQEGKGGKFVKTGKDIRWNNL